MAEFGSILRKLMADKKVTAVDLSRAINVPVRSIHEWTRRDRFPREPEVIQALAEFFRCSIHRLLFGHEDPHSDAASSFLEKTIVHSGVYEITIRRVEDNASKN